MTSGAEVVGSVPAWRRDAPGVELGRDRAQGCSAGGLNLGDDRCNPTRTLTSAATLGRNGAGPRLPVTEDYLRDEGPSPAFIAYMRNWDNFVAA
jgi:hypothetical protein